MHLEYVSLGARIAPRLPTLGIKKLSLSYHMHGFEEDVSQDSWLLESWLLDLGSWYFFCAPRFLFARRPKSTLQKFSRSIPDWN